MSPILAIRAFFRTMFSAETARRVAAALETREVADKLPAPRQEKLPEPVKPKPPARSDSLTLLATLQREARFVDFIKEPLDQYSDAQIGAAARSVHHDCRAVLDRIFVIQPISTAEEGAELEVPAGFDPGRWRLTGNVRGEPPVRGQMVHHGWQASKCELPVWSGSRESALIIAPVEVELK